MASKHIAPRKGVKAFHCPHCGVYAQQTWYRLAFGSFGRVTRFDALPKQFSLSNCGNCGHEALWHDNRLVFPASSTAPVPADDMPRDVRADVDEARGVVNASPRAAAALLRLALQKLMSGADEGGGELNGDVGRIVRKGLPAQIQEALHSVRVIGPDAIRPGCLDSRDNAATAEILFTMVNIMVEKMITEPGRLQQIHQQALGAKRETSALAR